VRTVRNDCLDRILILGRRHLERDACTASTTTSTGRTAPSSSCLQTAETPAKTATRPPQPPSVATTSSGD
jgi:hypothetical protein